MANVAKQGDATRKGFAGEIYKSSCNTMDVDINAKIRLSEKNMKMYIYNVYY